MRSRRVRSEAAKGEASEFANGDLGAKNLRLCSKIPERERGERGGNGVANFGREHVTSLAFEKRRREERGGGFGIWTRRMVRFQISGPTSHEPRWDRW